MSAGEGFSWRALSQELRWKGIRFWLQTVVIIVAGVFAGHHLEEVPWVNRLQSIVLQRLIDLRGGEPNPGPLRVVLIDNTDYWRGEFAHRVPIDARALAGLIAKIARGRPQVLAMDFNLSSRTADDSQPVHAAYQAETMDLVATVRGTAASGTKVVLPRSIGHYAAEEGCFHVGSDVYDRQGLASTAGVSFGVIRGSRDMRLLTTTFEICGGSPQVSLARAIVEAFDPRAKLPPRSMIAIASYVPEERLYDVTVNSSEIRDWDDEALIREFGGKIVILSGAWARDGYERGERIDLHWTPLGMTSGAYIHAMHVAALLRGDRPAKLSAAVILVAEVVFSLAAVAVFVWVTSLRGRCLALCIVVVASLLAGWQLLQIGALYFDPLVPTAFALGHLLWEEKSEWTVRRHGSDPLLEEGATR